jgi:hypothetical protein
MIRESLATTSKHFFLYLTGAHGLQVQYRPTQSGMTFDKNVSPTPSEKTLYVKITKKGNVLQAYYKRIGDTNWSEFGSAQTIEFSASYFFGIAVLSGDNSKKATLKAQDLTVYDSLSCKESLSFNLCKDFIINFDKLYLADPKSRPNPMRRDPLVALVDKSIIFNHVQFPIRYWFDQDQQGIVNRGIISEPSNVSPRSSISRTFFTFVNPTNGKALGLKEGAVCEKIE